MPSVLRVQLLGGLSVHVFEGDLDTLALDVHHGDLSDYGSAQGGRSRASAIEHAPGAQYSLAGDVQEIHRLSELMDWRANGIDLPKVESRGDQRGVVLRGLAGGIRKCCTNRAVVLPLPPEPLSACQPAGFVTSRGWTQPWRIDVSQLRRGQVLKRS